MTNVVDNNSGEGDNDHHTDGDTSNISSIIEQGTSNTTRVVVVSATLKEEKKEEEEEAESTNPTNPTMKTSSSSSLEPPSVLLSMVDHNDGDPEESITTDTTAAAAAADTITDQNSKKNILTNNTSNMNSNNHSKTTTTREPQLLEEEEEDGGEPKPKVLQSQTKSTTTTSKTNVTTTTTTTILLFHLPSDAWHSIASFLHPSDLRSMSVTCRSGRLACKSIFHRIRMHGFRCATEVISAWSMGEYEDAKELATLYIKAGVPIYPPSNGYALNTLLWRMKVETDTTSNNNSRGNHNRNHHMNGGGGNHHQLDMMGGAFDPHFMDDDDIPPPVPAMLPPPPPRRQRSRRNNNDTDDEDDDDDDDDVTDRFFHERHEARDHRRMVRLFEAQNSQNASIAAAAAAAAAATAAGGGAEGIPPPPPHDEGVGIPLFPAGGGMFPPPPLPMMGAGGIPQQPQQPQPPHRAAALLGAGQPWNLDATTHGFYPQVPPSLNHWNNETTWTYLEEKALFWFTVHQSTLTDDDDGNDSNNNNGGGADDGSRRRGRRSAPRDLFFRPPPPRPQHSRHGRLGPRGAPQARPGGGGASGSAATIPPVPEPSVKLKCHAHLIREHLLHHPSAIHSSTSSSSSSNSGPRIVLPPLPPPLPPQGNDLEELPPPPVVDPNAAAAAAMAAGVLVDAPPPPDGGLPPFLTTTGRTNNGNHNGQDSSASSNAVSLSADFYHHSASSTATLQRAAHRDRPTINGLSEHEQILLGRNLLPDNTNRHGMMDPFPFFVPPHGAGTGDAADHPLIPPPHPTMMNMHPHPFTSFLSFNSTHHPAREALYDSMVESYSAQQGISSDLKQKMEYHRRQIISSLNHSEVDFDICLYNVWDELAFPRTKRIAYHDGQTAVPRLDTLMTFLTTPCPKHVGVVQCEIERVKVTSSSEGSRRRSSTLSANGGSGDAGVASSGGVGGPAGSPPSSPSKSSSSSSSKTNMRGRLFPTYEYRLFIRDRQTTDSAGGDGEKERDHPRGGGGDRGSNGNGNADSPAAGSSKTKKKQPKHLVLMTAQNHGKGHFGLEDTRMMLLNHRNNALVSEKKLQHSSSSKRTTSSSVLLDRTTNDPTCFDRSNSCTTTSPVRLSRSVSDIGTRTGERSSSVVPPSSSTTKKWKKKRGVNNYFLQLAKPQDNEWNRMAHVLPHSSLDATSSTTRNTSTASHTSTTTSSTSAIKKKVVPLPTNHTGSIELGRLQSNLLGTEFQIFLPRRKPMARALAGDTEERCRDDSFLDLERSNLHSSTVLESLDENIASNSGGGVVVGGADGSSHIELQAGAASATTLPSTNLRSNSGTSSSNRGSSFVSAAGQSFRRLSRKRISMKRRDSWPILIRNPRTNRRAIAHADPLTTSSSSRTTTNDNNNGDIDRGSSSSTTNNTNHPHHYYYGRDIENGAITYTANLLGNRPRIMDVCIPRLPTPSTTGADSTDGNAAAAGMVAATASNAYASFDDDGYLECLEWERYCREVRRKEQLADEGNSGGGGGGGQGSLSSEGTLMLPKFKELQERLNSSSSSSRRGGGSNSTNNAGGAPTNNNRNNHNQRGNTNNDVQGEGGTAIDATAATASPDESAVENDFGLLALQNRPPWWNTELGAFVLNFGGRVSVASVKNFQLCDRNDQEYVMLQFGRIQGRHSFTMDFQWPLTGVQAFAIAISSLQSKISLG